MKKAILISLVILLLLPFSFAEEEYSFEKAEELTPLIKWRDYEPQSFQEAQTQNKPVFLLLTAPSWCYWCQVYESEDYLFHPSIVSYINENFIPIYVDADQRQDLTRQYLEGGWPSTTIMTPQGVRIYGYSGPRPVPNMLSNMRGAVESVKSSGFSGALKKSYNYNEKEINTPSGQMLGSLINGYSSNILQSFDREFGGFGGGQKFPQGRTLDLSLEMYELSGNSDWLNLVLQTLANQYTTPEELEINYNLFDPIDGGFHRYGTTREWTPPHYEKMLYDNARLLKTYYHLSKIVPNNELVQEVVSKTTIFINDNWYDHDNGGFYGNSDVHGEDAYYGKNPRPDEKPRVEKTKYTDWNSEAIITYLYIGEIEKAKQSLDFFANNMVGENGAFHFYKDGKKSGQGNLFDNCNLLLAFVEGYEATGELKYLETAKVLADYSIENLYDWNSGGFFERNSPDKEMFALGDYVDLSKPSEENGIMIYALLKLYQQSGDPKYLFTSIRSVGNTIESVGGLDVGYYHIKSAQYIADYSLIEEFENIKTEFEVVEKGEQKSFWLIELLDKPVNDFIISGEGLSDLNGSIILLILVALISGFISFASPCSLPILPAFIAYSLKSEKNNLKRMTFAFFLGLSTIFTLLGMSATFIGNYLKSNLETFSSFSGIIIIIFGLYILTGRGFNGIKIKHKKPASYLGSFIFGAALGVSWTPCVGPILVAILILASTSSSFLTGGFLLFSYSIGLALPLIFVSLYLEKLQRKGKLWRIIRGKEIKITIGEKEYGIHSNSLISGVIFIVLGYLIYSGILFTFNQYFASTGFQKIIFAVEDFFLNFVR